MTQIVEQLAEADIRAIQERYRDDIIAQAYEALRIIGSDSERDRFTEQLQINDFAPQEGVSAGLRAVLITTGATIHRQNESFEYLRGQVKRGLAARLVIPLLPEDPATYFWSRCAIEYSRSLRVGGPNFAGTPPQKGAALAIPPEPFADDEASLLSVAAQLAHELRLQEHEVGAALHNEQSRIGVLEQEFVTAVRAVQGDFSGTRLSRLEILTAIRAAYAFRRWADISELPDEFLAAALLRMGITSMQFDRFAQFVADLPRNGREDPTVRVEALRRLICRQTTNG